MPAFDGTGPRSLGPMSGKGRGLCNKTGSIGFKRGFGMGQGCRFNNVNFTPAEETKVLEANIKAQKDDIKLMQNRLDELNKQDS